MERLLHVYIQADNISPDVITCSVLMNTFEKGRNWKAAVTLLGAMQRSQQASREITDIHDDDRGQKWSLPYPNTYTYSMAISICARCNQGKMALSLLRKMEDISFKNIESTDCDAAVIVQPNTWVYNAAILACVRGSSAIDDFAKSATASFAVRSGTKSDGHGGMHLDTALGILSQMETAGTANEDVCRPDAVTYNTVLSILDETAFTALKETYSSSFAEEKIEGGVHNNLNHRLLKHDRILDVVLDILDTMEARGVARDSITYYNAILACRSSRSAAMDAVTILRKSCSDPNFTFNGINESIRLKTQPLKGRAASGMIFVANAALSVASMFGDVNAVSDVLALLLKAKTKLNSQSIVHIVQTLGKVADCEGILALLICLRGQSFANNILKERYSIDVLANMPDESIPMVEENVYSVAITSCLKHDALGAADQILLSMKKHGLTLNQRSLKEVISEYCRMAMSSSKEEFKIARLAKRQGSDDSQYGVIEPMYITSLARAKAALAMLKAVETPSPSLMSAVAKALCSAGLFQDARSILRRMHRTAIRELRLAPGVHNDDPPSSFPLSHAIRVKGGGFLDELPRLHRSLLKFCAKGGNITPALNFADDIREF